MHLFAVRHLHIISTCGYPLQGKLYVKQLLNGVKRIKPRAVDPRDLDFRLATRIKDPHAPIYIMLWAAYSDYFRAREFNNTIHFLYTCIERRRCSLF